MSARRFAQPNALLRCRTTEHPQQFLRAADQRRPRGIQPFIANYPDTIVLHRIYIFPGSIAQRRGQLCAVASGSPRQNDHIRIRFRYLLVRDSLPEWNDNRSSCQCDEFVDPGRGTDARIRPRLAIHFGAFRIASRATSHDVKAVSHAPNELVSGGSAIYDTSQQPDVVLDVGKTSRINGQERDWLCEELRHGIWSEGNRTNHQSRLQPHHSGDIQLPAIADSWTTTDGRDVLAPAAHADKLSSSAQRQQNRRHIRRERHDSDPLTLLHSIFVPRILDFSPANSRVTANRKTKARRRGSLSGALFCLGPNYCAASTFLSPGFGICQSRPASSALFG